MFLISPIIYGYISISKDNKRTDFKGKEFSNYVQKNLDKGNRKVLRVIGDEWYAGNLSYHLEERPKWIFDKNNTFICNKDLKCIKYK